MKKAIWVVAVDGYHPELCKITLPNLEQYASRIGADFTVIRERRWPSWVPAPYEKLQVHKLGDGYDWNIIIDADIFIDPNMHDPTKMVPDTTVASWMCYDASQQFPDDIYFHRDGRKLGISTNFLFIPKSCHEALTPFPDNQLLDVSNIKRPFILDEYCVSRNVARFGLKHCGILIDLKNPPFRHINATSGHESHV